MAEIELSIMDRSLHPIPDIKPSLDQFEAETSARIHVTVLEWDIAWSEVLRTALYRHGPDISEMGSTWVSSLVGMNSLRSFSNEELVAIGGPGNFISSLWDSGKMAGEKRVWAIPWLGYTRIIYYRRDLLNKAGIDEKTAFQSNAQLVNTLTRLQEIGGCTPWGVPIRQNQDTLHNLASWVWNEGGDFVSEDGRHILFHKEKAMAGMKAYFDLYRFLNKDEADQVNPETGFRQGRIAVIASEPQVWPNQILHSPDVTQEVASNIAAAPVTGVPFVGSSHLVVWKHTRNEQTALQLIKHLTSLKTQLAYTPISGLLPVRTQVLDNPPYSTEPIFQVMSQSIKSGRTFLSIPLWGLVENKLTLILDRIWEDILSIEHPDIEGILHKRLDPLAQQLELTLSQN
jgi:multiple sugar transport system substrate-binding protein